MEPGNYSGENVNFRALSDETDRYVVGVGSVEVLWEL